VSDWHKAQGLDEYEQYVQRRRRDLSREAVRETVERGGFDAEFLRPQRGPQPLRLARGDLSRLLAEEQAGSVEITREEGRIVAIRRITDEPPSEGDADG
jgi:hypothetical protein